MSWLKSYTKDWEYADYIIAAQLLVFPWFSRLMPLLVVALVVGVFFSRRTFKLENISPKKPAFWMVLLFLMHVVGLLWSEDQLEGWNDIGMKLSLLVIPLAMVLVKINMRREQFSDLLIAGLVLSCVINYSYAIFKSIYHQEDNHWAYFTESYFSFNMHRSYYAVYVVIGAVAALQRFFQSTNWRYLFFVVLFGVVTLQTFSKVGIILLVLTVIPLAAYYFFRMFGGLRAGIFTILILVLGGGVFLSSSKMQVRFQKMVEAALGETSNAPGTIESNSSRVIMWETSLNLFWEAPIIGSGTGDVMHVLKERNIRNGDVLLAKKRLNSHNQYLNNAVQLGLLGLIPLVFIFITSLAVGFKRRDLLFVLTAMILGVSLFFESSLERQDGVIPITLLIICLTMITPLTEVQKENLRD